MKKLFRALTVCAASGAFAFSGQAQANCFDNCDWLCFDGCWEVGAAAVYYKPCLNRFHYANITTNVAAVTGTPQMDTVTTKIMRPDYDWGFRVFGAWNSCDGCEFVKLSYTWVETSDKIRVHPGASPELLEVCALNSSQKVDAATFADAGIGTRYQKALLHVGRNLHCACGSQFYAYAGARYFQLEDKRSIRTLGLVGGTELSFLNLVTSFEKAETNGFAIDVGVGGEYSLWCDLNLVAQFGVFAGLGEEKQVRDVRQVLISTGATSYDKTRSETHWGCVPGFDMRIGINYSYACGCWNFEGELGWEADYYFGGLLLRDSGCSEVSETRLRDVAYSGPYAAIKLHF